MSRLVSRFALLGALLLAASSAFAGWELRDGAAVTMPSQTNGNVARLLLHCVDGPVFSVYATGGGVVRPMGPGPVFDYFYQPGFIRADVDGQIFPLVAAGSDDAVVLFSEGALADSYLAPLDIALIKAMRAGKQLTLRFDLTPAYSTDRTAYETTASFPLAGAAGPIKQAVKGCL